MLKKIRMRPSDRLQLVKPLRRARLRRRALRQISPGRPSELSDDQFKQFTAVLHEPLEEAGYDDPAWSSVLAQRYLIETFDVAFSRRHVCRPMYKARVSTKSPRPEPISGDEDEREEFEEIKKVGRRDEDATVVTI